MKLSELSQKVKTLHVITWLLFGVFLASMFIVGVILYLIWYEIAH